jgi:hypothetical protein
MCSLTTGGCPPSALVSETGVNVYREFNVVVSRQIALPSRDSQGVDPLKPFAYLLLSFNVCGMRKRVGLLINDALLPDQGISALTSRLDSDAVLDSRRKTAQMYLLASSVVAANACQDFHGRFAAQYGLYCWIQAVQH